MASFNGKVERVTITTVACCLSLRNTSGTTQFVLLWSYPTSDSSAEARLRHSMWLSLARDALTNDKAVTAVYPSGSSLVTAFTLVG